MAVMEDEVDGEGEMDDKVGELNEVEEPLRSAHLTRENSLEEDSWGYKTYRRTRTRPGVPVMDKGKQREREGSGPSLRRGWSLVPGQEDEFGAVPTIRTTRALDSDLGSGPAEDEDVSGKQRAKGQRSDSWEELAITSPPRPPFSRQGTSGSGSPSKPSYSRKSTNISQPPGILPPSNPSQHQPIRSHIPRPEITSYTSFLSTASTALPIPPPEKTDMDLLIPDGDKAKRLKRPAVISWTSEPYLPIAARFEKGSKGLGGGEEEWEGPY